MLSAWQNAAVHVARSSQSLALNLFFPASLPCFHTTVTQLSNAGVEVPHNTQLESMHQQTCMKISKAKKRLTLAIGRCVHSSAGCVGSVLALRAVLH